MHIPARKTCFFFIFVSLAFFSDKRKHLFCFLLFLIEKFLYTSCCCVNELWPRNPFIALDTIVIFIVAMPISRRKNNASYC